MNTIECPRCGHDHGPHWGDKDSNVGDGAARCHADAKQGRPGDRWCVCTLSLSSALATVGATRARGAVQGIESTLYDVARSLERMGATLEVIAQVLEVRR